MRRSTTLTWVALWVLVVLFASSNAGEANHGRPYSQAVTNARQYAREHVNKGQWPCLDKLIHAESGWSLHGTTPKWASPENGAYGLGQALPGRKMNRAERPQWGPKWDDFRYDWRVQITWVLRYIRGRYGTMCHAFRFQGRHGYY